MPHNFSHISAILSRGYLTKRGHFGDPMGWPGFFWNSVKIMDNLSSSDEAQFQPLIAAGDSLFWAPFPTPPTGPDFTHISEILNRD